MSDAFQSAKEGAKAYVQDVKEGAKAYTQSAKEGATAYTQDVKERMQMDMEGFDEAVAKSQRMAHVGGGGGGLVPLRQWMHVQQIHWRADCQYYQSLNEPANAHVFVPSCTRSAMSALMPTKPGSKSWARLLPEWLGTIPGHITPTSLWHNRHVTLHRV